MYTFEEENGGGLPFVVHPNDPLFQSPLYKAVLEECNSSDFTSEKVLEVLHKKREEHKESLKSPLYFSIACSACLRKDKLDAKLKKCQRCHTAYYCSREW